MTSEPHVEGNLQEHLLVSPEKTGFFFRVTWKAAVMSVPTFIMFLAMAALNLICIGLVGNTGTDIDLAAIGLSNVFCNVTGFSMLWGLASALDTLSPQALGAKAPTMLGVYLQRCMLLCSIFGVLPILLIWIFASPLLLAFGQDPDVVKGVEVFALWRIPGLIAITVFIPISKSLTALGKTSAIGAASLVTTGVAAGLAYLLISYFNMGVRGASMVQSSREVFQMVFLIIAALREPEFRKCWTPWSKLALQGWGEFMKLAVPAMVMQNVEWWSWELVTFESGLLSADILATQTVLGNISNMTYYAPLALSYSTSMLVGQFLGAREVSAARRCAMIMVVDTLAVLGVCMGAIVLSREPVADVLTGGGGLVRDTVVNMVPLCMIFSFLDGFQSSLTGVVKGTGSQRMFAPIILLCYWIVGLPLGYVFAFHLDLKLHGLWFGMMTGAGLHCMSYALLLKFCVSFERASDEAVARLKEESPSKSLVDVAAENGELGKPFLETNRKATSEWPSGDGLPS